MDNSKESRNVTEYERRRFSESDLRCPVGEPNALFGHILGAIGMPYERQEDEWAWERYLDAVNASLQDRLGCFQGACIQSGIPPMHVNIFCDGERLSLRLRMGMVSYPSGMNTGALFDWLRDFVLGVILSQYPDGTQMSVRLDDADLTVGEVRAIAEMIGSLNGSQQGIRFRLCGANGAIIPEGRA